MHHGITVSYIVQTPFKTLLKPAYGSKYITFDPNTEQLSIYITNKLNITLYNIQFFTHLYTKLFIQLFDILLTELYCTCRLQ